ncbi:MAG TPA: DUF721 domain-containing protein [Rhizomicrobium sp.]|jgi:hypothetical protein|nr:DUF721 domain-containing protein [Rhizomicrobium sp.]
MARGAKQPPPEEGSPQRRGRAAAVAGDAQRLARTGFERAGFPEPGLVLRWQEIVGPEVARIARPLRFSQGATGGVLTLKADPAASVFLQHESRALCGRINAYLGREAVQRLRFVPGEIAAGRDRARRPGAGSEASADDPARQFSGSESLKSALLALARLRRGER